MRIAVTLGTVYTHTHTHITPLKNNNKINIDKTK